MIQMQTELNVADNSGAKKVMCIKVLGGTRKKFANINDVIKVSIKVAIPNSKVKKGDVLNAVIVRSKYGVSRKDGTYIKFDTNAVVLLDNKNQPIGTRIFGPIAKELKTEKYMKISSLALELI